jgi:hypothetical protein
MVSSGRARKSAGKLGRRTWSRWLAEWDFETAVVVEERERNLRVERALDSSRPEAPIRLASLVVDKAYRRTDRTRACSAATRRVSWSYRKTDGRRQRRIRQCLADWRCARLTKSGRGADAR